MILTADGELRRERERDIYIYDVLTTWKSRWITAVVVMVGKREKTVRDGDEDEVDDVDGMGETVS